MRVGRGMIGFRDFSAVCLVFGAVCVARAQQAKPAPVEAAGAAQQPGAYSLQVNSQIVVLDVVVNNKTGEPVAGLIEKDFKVYEDKVPQTVVSFETPKPAGAEAANAEPVAIHSTTELDKLEPNAPVSIIVLDEVTTKFEDEAFARYSLKRYLNSQSDTLSQPTMLMAVNLQRVMVLRDYTTSKKEILDALARHFATYNWQALNGSWKGEQFAATFGSLMSVAEATAGHPGHKNMVWVGRGFPSIRWDRLPQSSVDEVQKLIATCTSLLRDARVTLYSVDPAGLSAAPPGTDEDGFYVDDPFGGQVDFDGMARATGGQAFHGRNDVDRLIGTGVRDGEMFYTITYRPSSQSQDTKAFRKIRVLMTDRTLQATTREGYYEQAEAVTPLKDAKGDYTTRFKFDVGAAVQSLMMYDGVPITIVRQPAGGDDFRVVVKASDLEWTTGDPGKRTTSVMLLVESFDRKGKALAQSAQMLNASLPELVAGAVDKAVLALPAKVATAAPVARLRFVVRASATGKIGADNVFLVDRKTLADPVTGLTAEKNRR